MFLLVLFVTHWKMYVEVWGEWDLFDAKVIKIRTWYRHTLSTSCIRGRVPVKKNISSPEDRLYMTLSEKKVLGR